MAVAALLSMLAFGVPGAFAAAPEPYQTGDPGGFRNILPPGENGLANASDIFAFETQHTYPPHSIDQLGKYHDLVYSSPGLSASDIDAFYKDASFGVQSGQVERTYSPPMRPGVVIVRDSGFGVPHVYGDTRADVEYGAGYVSAEDRLFFMDVLRHAGRAQLSGFAGGSNRGLDADQWQFAPYTEADLRTQYDFADEVYGAEGAALQQDVQNYVDGINAYVAEARLNPNKMPGEYGAVGQPLQDFTVTDPIATASLIGGLLGKGGGGELDSAQILQAAQQRFGRGAGQGVWRDFRRAEDPEAPTTVRGTSFPYQAPHGINPAAVAMPDPGSVVAPGGTSSQSVSAGASGLSGLLHFPRANSNALLVSAANSTSGHPVAVMGPQVAYFMPEVLMDIDLHCIGTCQGQRDIDARGATFPGVSLYVLLGRGADYAWSATSAGQDIIDTFAEPLCEPSGAQPTVNSTSYLYKGECRAMETLSVTNVVTPNPGDQCSPDQSSSNPCGPYTLTSQRTVHGIVYKRGTVKGKPVAFARQRSSYFHEADSARAFADMNDPNTVQSVQDFQHAMFKMNLTFNWFFADEQDIGYINSGSNPVRARGTDPNLPNWGGGRYDWQGFKPPTRDQNGNIVAADAADFTSFAEHPQVINQSYITSWNNKQAPAFRAADDQWGYGPLYRSLPLDHGIENGLANGGKFTVPKLVDAMEDAGTVDLRGSEVLPYMLQVVGSPSQPELADAVSKLQAWVSAGAHRRDCTPTPPACTPDGHYEHEDAIRIMDAWWPRAVEAQFRPTLGAALYSSIQGMLGLDNAPNNHGDHLGSAYQGGWYGYVHKDLRQLLGLPVQGAFSRIYCGNGNLSNCRGDLRNSLKDALNVPASQLYDENPSTPATDRVTGCPSTASDQWCYDSVKYRAIGAITVDTQPWINRPTFQQAVEVPGNRP